MKCALTYKFLKTVSEYKNSVAFNPIQLDRSRVKIAIIDNDGFDRDLLAQTGFSSVTPFKTYEAPEPFESFDIILCDIDGVGKALNAQEQGVAVARMLKEIYPTKVILLYSGKNPNDFSDDYRNSCDGFIAKDLSMSEMAKALAGYCKPFIDPVDAWERSAKYLIQRGLSFKSIAWLEDAYVTSLLKKEKLPFDSFAGKLGIAADVISIIASLLGLFI